MPATSDFVRELFAAANQIDMITSGDTRRHGGSAGVVGMFRSDATSTGFRDADEVRRRDRSSRTTAWRA